MAKGMPLVIVYVLEVYKIKTKRLQEERQANITVMMNKIK